MKRQISILCISLFALFCTPISAAFGDEVKDYLKRAQELYDQKNYSEAISELQFAISKIQDLQAEGYQTVLPEPPQGWTASEIQTNKMPGAIMGGGVTLTRSYSNDRGESIEITVMGESPAVSSILMMASNPMFLGGNKLVRVKGNKAIEEWHDQDKSGTLSIIVGSKCIVTVEGSSLEAKDTLYQFANLVDYDKIKKLMEEQ